jgi:hypothetical protein
MFSWLLAFLLVRGSVTDSLAQKAADSLCGSE